MTAAMRSPRYFVLVVNGRPLTLPESPDVPVVFREEREALTAGQSLQTADQSRTVVLESYADDYSFVGGRRLDPTFRSASL